ncbi:collagen alpha-4(vi) chain [Plakobranchus ocellatus]|uniref:Collagen alpha-4(Vi) chain n=1 Tax=Plakobranchus ocellatus TaxID=259542 RepID=A0AAV4DQW9_9GAST|nr:collagen alpha-4(vi) chain [Plakobranchus ocellatus]
MARAVVTITTYILLLCCFQAFCQGFDFTLDPYVSLSSSESPSRQPCGVLRCNETLVHVPDEHSGFSRHIKTLTVCKKVKNGSNEIGSWKQLASISSERSSESSVSNGARIFGQLTDNQAYLSIDLIDTHSCQSGQFSCVASIEDSQGVKSIKKSVLGKEAFLESDVDFEIENTKNSLDQVNRKGERSSSDGIWPQFVNPFQIKLDWIESRLEDALKNLENRLEDKVGDLKATVIDRIERAESDVENKLDETESRTDRLQNRLEDKLEQLDTRVTETLLLTRATAANANDNAFNLLVTKIDGLENRLKDDLSQLESCATEIVERNENDNDVRERLFEQLSIVVHAVQSIENNISCLEDQHHHTEMDAGQSSFTVSGETTKLSELVISVASLTDLTQHLLTSVQTFSNSYAGGTLVPVDEFSDPLGSGEEWRLVFRGTAYNNVALYPAYLHGTGIPLEVEQGCKQFNKSLPCINHYRNQDAVDNWINIDKVLFAIYKDDHIVKHVVFNGRGSTYTSWFHVGRVLLSSWDDLITQPHNIFSIVGETSPNSVRRFFMSLDYHRGCDGYRGWFFAFDTLHGGCPAEKTAATPTFPYAAGNTFAVWTSANKALADAIGVFVKYI